MHRQNGDAAPVKVCASPLSEVRRYKAIAKLGDGGCGFVQLAQNTETKEEVAIKFLKRGDELNIKLVQREILNHRMIRHPCVVEFKEVFLTTEYICIVMEHAKGGDLAAYVQQQRTGRLDEVAARWFFQQVIFGVDYCHRRGVVNRDIKLQNTLLDQHLEEGLPLLKLCDFGYSKDSNLSAPKSKLGTLAYMAPEVFTAIGQYDGRQADIWSTGVMLFAMLFGHYPFWRPEDDSLSERAQHLKTRNRILGVDWSVPSNVNISGECRDLLMKILVGDPKRRITMRGILDHPFYLTHLPPPALTMNDELMECEENSIEDGSLEEESQIQPMEEITALLEEAKTQGRSEQDWRAAEMVMDGLIDDDLKNNSTSFDYTRFTSDA